MDPQYIELAEGQPGAGPAASCHSRVCKGTTITQAIILVGSYYEALYRNYNR